MPFDFPLILLVLIVLAVVQLLLLVWLLARRAPKPDHTELIASLGAGNERTERELRREIAENARGTRQETAQAFATFQQALLQQGAESTRTQNAQIDAFGQQLAHGSILPESGELRSTCRTWVHPIREQ